MAYEFSYYMSWVYLKYVGKILFLINVKTQDVQLMVIITKRNG